MSSGMSSGAHLIPSNLELVAINPGSRPATINVAISSGTPPTVKLAANPFYNPEEANPGGNEGPANPGGNEGPANPGGNGGPAIPGGSAEDAAYIAAGREMVRSLDTEIYIIGKKYVTKKYLAKMTVEEARDEICGFLDSKEAVMEMLENRDFRKSWIWNYLVERKCKAWLPGKAAKSRLPRHDEYDKKTWILALYQHLAGETVLKFGKKNWN